MHMQMDNVEHLQQYIPQYTVANPTSFSNVVSHWMMSGFMLQDAFAFSAMYTLKNENVKKCIKKGITILTIVIWGGKQSVLSS